MEVKWESCVGVSGHPLGLGPDSRLRNSYTWGMSWLELVFGKLILGCGVGVGRGLLTQRKFWNSRHSEVLEDTVVEYDWIVAPRDVPVPKPGMCECYQKWIKEYLDYS